MRPHGGGSVGAKSYLLVTIGTDPKNTSNVLTVRTVVLVAQRLPELGQPGVRRGGLDGGHEGEVRRAQAAGQDRTAAHPPTGAPAGTG